MPGTKIVLDTTFTDLTLPKIRIDPVVPDAGALFLYDPNHPESPVTGAVANGLLLPNLVQAQATAMGAPASLPGSVNIGSSYLGALGFVERSGKGGLHFSIGTTQADTSTRYARVDGADALRTYLNANKGHSFYHSAWQRITRASGAVVGAGNPMARVGASFQLPYFYTRTTGTSPGRTVYPVDARNIGWFTYGAVGAAASGVGTTAKSDTGPAMWAGAVSDFTAIADISSSSIIWNDSKATTTNTNGASTIFYRAYVEDLTVSGRTYAQVQALDYAEFTKQVLTAGGRYYNDTFTAPLA